jgi:hypothetical protein
LVTLAGARGILGIIIGIHRVAGGHGIIGGGSR